MRISDWSSDVCSSDLEGLRASGVKVEELPDGLVVEGSGGGKVSGGATIASHLDHRIAMSFAVLGLAARKAVTIDDARDRKSVVSGTSVSVRLDLGGRRMLNTTT